MVLGAPAGADAEVVEFQMLSRECLAGTFEGTAGSGRGRFLRIQKLITDCGRNRPGVTR